MLLESVHPSFSYFNDMKIRINYYIFRFTFYKLYSKINQSNISLVNDII